ncbi:glutamine synthetase family protein [Ornithinimicrobium sp. INDO-MA30-4]|uniref:glutamine synthetase family protein n=1 Tax=Ornithinimicrobium sp. INDO-MA30-4 TaxID=2908651 RepID=UPI001F49134E|nr:glutamine synthetase family protein [Ornithinimicrobium sp. INDO-MA30-4]UJH70837.1 glutamine synthetase family protein [Ornithinimicrobium sp. INDO-MA30-4]
MEHLDPEELARKAEELAAQGIDVVRLGYSDIIGTDRGRDLLVSGFERTAGGGVAFCRSVYATTPMGDVVPIEGGLEAGLPDIIARPVLETTRALPWEPGVAHCIGELFNADGSPSEESPRNVLKRVAAAFAELDITPMIGPELEFYVLEKSETSENGWAPYGQAPGNVYVSGLRGDPDNSLLDSLRNLEKYGLDVVAANHEFSSGQFEINMWHSDALDAADRSHRFKAAVQELSRYHDKLATFMAKPYNDEGGSGFHLHFSALDSDGTPVFDGPNSKDGLSDLAHHAIAGILAHAPALAALSNPTINSYKRFGPDTLAPWLIDWGLDNRSAMVRIPPERGKASRLELRLGDASANPYLAIGGMMAAAYLGVRDKLELQDPLEGYGYDVSKADMLPTSLGEALDALEADEAMVDLLGPAFTKTFVAYKRNEIERFNAFITDWEFREYTYHL